MQHVEPWKFVACGDKYKMSTTCSIPDTLDHAPLSSYQVLVFSLCFLVAMLDGFDTQAIAYTGPALMTAFNLAPGELAPVMTSGVIGMAIGAMTLGLLGDRVGRRPAILGAVFLFACATLATAFAQNVTHIVMLRFLAGLGMGGATPLLLALAAEYGPARHRGAITTGVLLGLPGGAILGGLLAAKLMPHIGWQGIYVIGGIAPLALLILLAVLLPESMQLQVAKGIHADRVRRTLQRITRQPVPEHARLTIHEQTVSKASVGALFTGGLARNTVAVWLTYLFNWVAWFMLLSWLPTVLKSAGLAADLAPYGTVSVNAVFIACAIPLSILLPRLNTRSILLVMLATGIVVAFGLGLAGQQWPLVFVLIGLAGFGIGGQQLALNYLIVTAYPTALRATATGWAIGVGRVGAIIGSAIGGVVLESVGPSGYFASLALPLILAVAAVMIIRVSRDDSQLSKSYVSAH
ncbi:MFS transporter [Pseudomonas fortuita]|uniref:MFS transporter n=1 Tax=Pseudomonas fortuita TaxID=3233375 RepID=UPI003DA07989